MSSDASSFPSQPPPQQPVRGGIPAWAIVLIVVGLLFFMLMFCGVLMALLLPAIQAAREAARRNACMSNMKQIGVALMTYHDTYDTFPPAYIPDADARPMHSWRVLILPFLEGPEAAAIYEQYDFAEPWDGPNNQKLAERMPSIFGCPSEMPEPGQTSYVAVVGHQTMWPGGEAVRISDISDGSGETLMLVEAADSGINWLEPRDLTMDEALQGLHPARGGIRSGHPSGANVLFADGHVELLQDGISPDYLRALLTKDGGEVVQ